MGWRLLVLVTVLAPISWASTLDVKRVVTTDDGLSGNDIRASHEAGDGSLWIGTRHNGISRLHDDSWTTFSTADGLLSEGNLSILDDDGGTSTEMVITRYGATERRSIEPWRGNVRVGSGNGTLICDRRAIGR